jgi:hypothetical protein
VNGDRLRGSSDVREPAVAGSFYPASGAELGRLLDRLLGAARPGGEPGGTGDARPGEASPLRGVVVPHAGYVYSGPVAATAYALVAASGVQPRTVVLLGPSHVIPVRGMAVPDHRAWRTPLGEVELDDAARQQALAAGMDLDDVPHQGEHSLEVQLPFLQRVLPGVPVLPVAVAWDLPIDQADLLAPLVAEDVLLVVSTDLSHYHDAATAHRLDARTAVAVTALDHEAIGPDDACGCGALRVSLAWAARAGVTARKLDLRTSADTAGGPDRVVGYGAFALERLPAASISAAGHA